MVERTYKPKIGRIAFVDRKIRTATKRGVVADVRKMAQEYEVCKETINRDIRYMRDVLEAPLKYNKKKHGWYYTEASYKMEHFQLSESDLFAICIAEQALAQYEGSPVYGSLRKVFGKITESLAPEVATVMPGLADNITMTSFPVTVADAENWKIVFDALKSKYTVKIAYQKPRDNKPEWRKIDPYHAVNYQGAWYVLGYCHVRNEVRIFNTSRIKNAEETMDTFTVPEDFNHEEKLRNSFDMYVGGATKNVRILFSAAAAPYIRERVWHPCQKLEENQDGSLLFSVEVNNVTGIIPWIFSWGPYAKILEPPELLEQFTKDLSGLVDNYRER